MRKLSLQWRLTILTTVLITVLCGCLTFFLYKNGVYYIETLQETFTDQVKKKEAPVSYKHLRAHETSAHRVMRGTVV